MKNSQLTKSQLLEIIEILEDDLYVVSGCDMHEDAIIKNLKTYTKQKIIDEILLDVSGARETLRRVARIKERK